MRTLQVSLGARSYPVHVGAGLLARANELIPAQPKAEKVALFGDSFLFEQEDGPAAALGESLRAIAPEVQRFPASGEGAKSVQTAEEMWQALSTNGFHRHDLVVAFGGGVVSDLAGFVAATYHRGMPWVVVPTTLLGMVDASIGGKTGINLPQGKNLVGAFHQPLAVIADIEMLATLPERALRTGLAEVVKYGLIADTGLLERLKAGFPAGDPDGLTALVADAAAVKVGVVSDDETEHGARAHLNYGHTLGHALETLDGYRQLTHGEAISIGMVFAAHLAVALGYADRIAEHQEVLGAAGLPASGARFEFEQVLGVLARDKKYEKGARFVVLEDLAKPILVEGISEEILRSAYEAVR